MFLAHFIMEQTEKRVLRSPQLPVSSQELIISHQTENNGEVRWGKFGNPRKTRLSSCHCAWRSSEERRSAQLCRSLFSCVWFFFPGSSLWTGDWVEGVTFPQFLLSGDMKHVLLLSCWGVLLGGRLTVSCAQRCSALKGWGEGSLRFHRLLKAHVSKASTHPGAMARSLLDQGNRNNCLPFGHWATVPASLVLSHHQKLCADIS